MVILWYVIGIYDIYHWNIWYIRWYMICLMVYDISYVNSDIWYRISDIIWYIIGMRMPLYWEYIIGIKNGIWSGQYSNKYQFQELKLWYHWAKSWFHQTFKQALESLSNIHQLWWFLQRKVELRGSKFLRSPARYFWSARTGSSCMSTAASLLSVVCSR